MNKRNLLATKLILVTLLSTTFAAQAAGPFSRLVGWTQKKIEWAKERKKTVKKAKTIVKCLGLGLAAFAGYKTINTVGTGPSIFLASILGTVWFYDRFFGNRRILNSIKKKIEETKEQGQEIYKKVEKGFHRTIKALDDGFNATQESLKNGFENLENGQKNLKNGQSEILEKIEEEGKKTRQEVQRYCQNVNVKKRTEQYQRPIQFKKY